MSNQYPGGYNSPLGGHRGQFNSPQHQQQQQQMMSQMGPNSMEVSQGGGNPMMPMGGYGTVAGPGGMMAQQQGMGVGVGVGQMNPVGMQSPSHMQQAQQQQQPPQMIPIQQQMQLQHQQQQQQMVGTGGGGGMPQHMGGMMGQSVQTGVVQNPNMVTSHLPQQQQHMSPHHMQTTTVPQPQGSGQLSIPPQQQQQQQSHQQQQQQNHQQQQHQQQQQQNITSQQSQQQSSTGGNTTTMSQANPHKEINIVQLSRLGQETVQDITSRFQEVLSVLKIIQPTQNRDNNTEKKVQEHFRTIRLLFKRVRIIFEKCNDGYPQGIEYAHVESLIPMKDEPDPRFEGAHCDEYRKVSQENQELVETVKLKNRQLREIIDRTRIIIWEINTMLAMRRS